MDGLKLLGDDGHVGVWIANFVSFVQDGVSPAHGANSIAKHSHVLVCSE